MLTRFLFLFGLFISSSANASFAIMDDCNYLEKGLHYQLTQTKGYCLDTQKSDSIITFINLSSQRIESANIIRDVSYTYPNEYVFTSSRLAIYNAKNIVFSMEEDGILVARDRSAVNDVIPMVVPLAIWVPPAVGGAILGVMGTVSSNPNAGFRDITIGAFSGAITGGFAPIIGAGVFGTVAAGSLGISAYGGCTSCH